MSQSFVFGKIEYCQREGGEVGDNPALSRNCDLSYNDSNPETQITDVSRKNTPVTIVVPEFLIEVRGMGLSFMSLIEGRK